MKKSGHVLMTAELGKEYGLEDVDGMRCLNIFVLLSQIKSKECVNFKMFKRNIITIKMFHIKKSQVYSNVQVPLLLILQLAENLI